MIAWRGESPGLGWGAVQVPQTPVFTEQKAMDFLFTKTMICCSSAPEASEQGNSQIEIIKEKSIFHKQNE